MDIRSSIAANAYATARPATQPQRLDQGDAFADAAQNFFQTLRTGEQTAMSAMSGGADPHALVQALAQSELAIETAVTVRDKVVEAYQEILRMPV
ncbi:flagellar hook-basal body complex protein FliE [Rhodovulum strictum]|uniref:Flagellar hook-basal body complex protein FliE n=1 Tax=Rhodovulum strictum TaxID=58314 RepID=A0A844BEP0_9RHOB|nr:flagellar hook-basal body complex protein FliE [Rhodovulum strictum]MRH21038.1 flagellar hook-basal body complex protein FliE [Rhodovulum strictum]